MTVTLVSRKSGETITEKGVIEFMHGSKWYWIEYENGDSKELSAIACDRSLTGRFQKVSAEEYMFVSVEA